MRNIMKKMVVVLLCFSILAANTNISKATEKSSAEKLNQLGLLTNIGQSELEETLTREIGLTMILKALGYTNADADLYISNSPFTDTQGWSKGWASLAYSLEITAGTSEKSFSPTNLLTEREFLTFLLRALGYSQSESYTSTLDLALESGLLETGHVISSEEYTKSDASDAMFNSLSSIVLKENKALASILIDKGMFTVEDVRNVGINSLNTGELYVYAKSYTEIDVVFSDEVITSNYVFDISSSNLDYRGIVQWNEEKTIASVQLVSPLEAGKYTMTTSEIVGDRTVEVNEFIVSSNREKLEILSDSVGYIDGAYINYSLSDIFNNEMYRSYETVDSVSAENLTNGIQHNIEFSNELTGHRLKLTDLVSEGAKIGDIIEVTIEINGQEVSKEVEVMIKGQFGSLELHKPLTTSGSDRFSLDEKNITIPYFAVDDKGTALKLDTYSTNYDQSNNIEIINSVVFTSSNPSVIDVDTIKINNNGDMKINLGSSPGTAVLRAFNTITKEASEVQITIYPEAELLSVDIMPQTDLLAIGEKIELDVIGYDQFGAQVSVGYISGLTYTSSDSDVVASSSAKLLNNVFTCESIDEGSVTLSIFNKAGTQLGSCDLLIVGEPEAQNINSLSVPKYIQASSNATFTMDYSDLVVVDQFAREYDLNTNDEIIYIIIEDDSTNLDLGAGSFDADGLVISGVDDEIAEDKYRIYIEDLEYSALIFTMTSVEEEDIKDYRLSEVETLKVDTNPSIDIYLTGYLDSGEEVIIDDDSIEIVTSSDLSVATATYDGNTITVIGVSEGSSLISVWNDSEIIATVTIDVLAADE